MHHTFPSYAVYKKYLPYNIDLLFNFPEVTGGDEFLGDTLDVGWNWVNQSTSTATLESGKLKLVVPGCGTNNYVNGIVRAVPSGDFYIYTRLYSINNTTVDVRYGILLSESTTGKQFAAGLYPKGNQTFYEPYNTPTTRSSYTNGSTAISTGWLRARVYNDGGTWKVVTNYVSNKNLLLGRADGWATTSAAFSLTFTPAYYGVYVAPTGVGTGATCTAYFDWIRTYTS